MAETGPIPINCGSTPVCAQLTILASGLILFLSTSSPLISNTAAAASLMPEEFPAVTVPFYNNKFEINFINYLVHNFFYMYM